MRKTKTKVDGAVEMARLLEGRDAKCEKVILVRHNLNTHPKGAIDEAIAPTGARALVRRLEFHHTSKRGSRLNIAENELSSPTRQCAAGRRLGDIPNLQAEVTAWSIDLNWTPRVVDWQMKVDDARAKRNSDEPKFRL